MIVDLAGSGERELDADFLVIGGGTVGLPVSLGLAADARVVCVESGGAVQDGDTHPLNEVIFRADNYKGASAGRFRCLGGASTRWGGALLPFQDADLSDAGWPISSAELAPYVADVEALFSLEAGPYEDAAFPYPLGRDHVQRLAKWPSFRKRNVAALLEGALRARETLQVWLHAHVVEVACGAPTVQVTAKSLAGDRLTVQAKKLIVAAGAIETTRLALLIGRQNGGAVSPALGRYFSDHISAEVAELVPARRSRLNRIVGFRFGRRGSMRNMRFELAPGAPARSRLPPSFVHIGFRADRPGGFDALRDLFQSLQRRKPPHPRVLGELTRHAPWLARALWWRFVEKRLLFPAGARLIAHAVIEQEPTAENRIALSPDRVDAFGVPLAEIVWRVSDQDRAKLVETGEAMGKTWASSPLSRLADWRSLDDAEIVKSLEHAEGVFHPTGSTRMGHDAASGVVDRDLNLFGVNNVQLLATSVLPTGGGANPTMTLLLLAMRCVDQHRRNKAK